MAEKYKHLGEDPDASQSLANALSFPFSLLYGTTELIENTDTGEVLKLQVNSGQSVGDAIANGQWKEEE